MLRDDLKTEFDALLPGHATEAGTSRRTALKAALGVGYAATALPIVAQTAIKTSSEGLTTGEVTIDVNGFKMAAFRAAPAGKRWRNSARPWKSLWSIAAIRRAFARRRSTNCCRTSSRSTDRPISPRSVTGG